jgi:multidrug efflux system outer membrane protein
VRLQRLLAVAARSFASQRETPRLTSIRRDAGFGEEFDVASAGSRVAAIELINLTAAPSEKLSL